MKKDHTNSLENPAYAIKDGHELVICDDCGEELVFSMQDKYHQFALGLRTVLYCLRVAEVEGNVPPLPEDWWINVDFKHYHKSIVGLALFNKEAFESCSLAHPRKNLSKDGRKPICTERERQILVSLQENFDQVAYLFQLYSGIVMTPHLAKQMLEWFVAEQGHLYRGGSLINAPWVFVYLSRAQSLWGRKIKDPELQEVLSKKVPTGSINENGQFITKGQEKVFSGSLTISRTKPT